ncbi:uncharacterized protein LOC117331055 [Pecten maximus]|uniref:uncharacterized protein LOC117331055 n=1 Tax=Pecten maximus TaxID=6579 RepID=UPI001459103C|nr:uncharacterized protein LOC117331055 [Pecten maximus]
MNTERKKQKKGKPKETGRTVEKGQNELGIRLWVNFEKGISGDMFPKEIEGYVLVFLSIFALGWGAAAPAVMTPSISVVAPFDTMTELHLSSMTKLELEVQFPAGLSESVKIELLPSIDEVIAILGDVTITHNGGNLGITPPTPVRYQVPATVGQPVTYDSRCVLDLNDVTNTDATNDIEDSILRLQYEAILVSLGTYSNGSVYWISSGLEYNNSYNVWIGQASYNLLTVPMTTSKTPVFNIIPPTDTNIPVNSLFNIQIDSWLPYPLSSYAAEGVSLAVDGSVTIVAVSMVSSGSNYNFLFDYEQLTTTDLSCDSVTPGSDRVRLDIGSVPNKGANQGTAATAADSILVQVTCYMSGAAVIGNEYSIGIGMEIDSSEVFVTTVNVTASALVPSTAAFTAVAQTPDPALVPQGGLAAFKANVTFQPQSSARYTLLAETLHQGNTKVPGLATISVLITNAGGNVPCPNTDTSYIMSNPSNGFIDKANMDMNVTDFGLASGAYDDTLEIAVVGLAMPGFAEDGETYILQLTVTNIDTGVSEVVQGAFTIGGTMTYDSPVAYSFNMYHTCTSNCLVATNWIDIYLDVTTESGTNPGLVTFELPIPSNISNNFFKVCSFEAINIGKNIPCVNNALMAVQTTLVTDADGNYEKILAKINPLCNLGFSSDPMDDKFTLKMTASYLNDSTVVDDDTAHFGLGVSYSDVQVYVAMQEICTKAITYFPSLAIVEGIAVNPNPNDTLTDLKLLSSLDGNTYFDKPVDWTSGANNGSHDIYTLANPFLTVFVRLAMGSVCQGGCYVDHAFIYKSLEGYLDIFRDTGDVLLRQMPWVLDKNPNTCFDLPVQGETPPVLYVRMNTTLLGLDINNFSLNVTGDGLYCDRHGTSRVVQIAYPMTTETDVFHADVGFCTFKTSFPGVGTVTTCNYECVCADPKHCGEIFMLFANYDQGLWKLCEISAANV